MFEPTPFPPALAAMSAAAAKASFEAGQADFASKGPQSHSTQGLAAFRLPDGTLRSAYDLYDPKHPIDAEPGLAVIHYKPQYSVNGYEGYSTTVSDFVPAEEILRADSLFNPGGDRDRNGALALAYVKDDEGNKALFWGASAGQLQGWLAALPSNSEVLKLAPTLIDIDNDRDPACAVMIRTAGSTRCYVASSDEAMLDWLVTNHSVDVKPGMTMPEAIKALEAHGLEYGWTVHAQTGQELTRFDKPNLLARLNELNKDAKAALFPYSGTGSPHDVVIRAATQIEMASIRIGESDPTILWAADLNALERRIANTLLEGIGSARRFGPYESGAVEKTREILDCHPEIEIRKGRGGVHMAWGAEPRTFAMVTERASGFDFGVAASTEDVLLERVAIVVAKGRAMIGCDDLDDLNYIEQVAAQFEILHMPVGAGPERMKAFRQELMAEDGLAPI